MFEVIFIDIVTLKSVFQVRDPKCRILDSLTFTTIPQVDRSNGYTAINFIYTDPNNNSNYAINYYNDAICSIIKGLNSESYSHSILVGLSVFYDTLDLLICLKK